MKRRSIPAIYLGEIDGMAPSFTLFIATSEPNAWAIPGFLRQLKKFFPEFHGDIVVNIPKGPFKEISSGVSEKYRNYDWSTRTMEALKQVKTEFVLLCLEDNFLTSPVDPNLLDAAVLTLKDDSRFGDINFGVDHHDQAANTLSHYSHCGLEFIVQKITQPALCPSLLRTSYLRKLLRKGEDPWTYESFVYWRAKFAYKKCLVYCGALDRPLWPAPCGGTVHGGKVKDEFRYLFTTSELAEADKPKGRAESFFLRLPGKIPTKRALYWLCRKLSIFHFSRSKVVIKN